MVGGKAVPSAWVGFCNCTVALGSAMVGAPGGLIAAVGDAAAGAGARRIVGAGDIAGATGLPKEIVGAGALGRGGPPVGVGGAVGVGGLTGGAIGTVADGTAGGASAAFNVMRTVSFLRGTLDVCFDGAGD